ncbi:sporulation-specific protein 15 isoform X3 [Brassica rapa]|uniref:sporulation-specific protein 15 isoform X3 n=1 Tax=Brassica campestris TaxID=3711 RepID=UPI00142E2389|nr:sporulation-specific protein 15 isoform X3 [Brassica rapa]
MDDEKKKKRNKKKKNKQNNSKRADGDAIPTEDGNHNGDADIALINQVPDSIELEPSSQQIIINQADEPGVVDYTSPNSEAVLEETIKQLRDEIGSHLQKEAVFEETVRRLETENESHIQKEALLEERLEHLRTESEAHIQKQALLEERLEHLRTENEPHIEKEVQLEKMVADLRTQNEAHIEKEGLLEERLEHLKTENEAHIQSEVSEEIAFTRIHIFAIFLRYLQAEDFLQALLEERLLHLRTENEAYIQKQAQLEERLLHLRTENETLKQNEEKLEERHVQYKTKNDVLVHEMSSTEVKMRELLDERSTFSQKEASLEKKLQQLQHDEESSTAAAEKSSIEMISSLNNEIGTLRAQVMKLEESRSNLQEQNNSLVETVSSLQVQRENHDNNVKGASEEELNSQIEAACTLVEKLITENAELVEKVNELCIQLNQSQRAFASPPESLAIEVQKSDALEEIPIHDEMIRIDDSGDIETALLERNLSEETVPVSVNPNGEIDVESQVAVAGEAEEVSGGVPLVDAPLIGAPFRLVSFVARYVSGADLAEKKQFL